MSVISFEEARKKLEEDGALKKYRSKLSTASAEAGLIHTDIDLDEDDAAAFVRLFLIVDKACRRPFSAKGKFARENAVQLPAAQDLGLITTRLDDETWGSVWLCTEGGMEWLKEIAHEITD